MKALNILFQMRYGSLLSSMILLSTMPKCRGYLVEASKTQNAKKQHKVLCGFKGIKSLIYFQKMLVSC